MKEAKNQLNLFGSELSTKAGLQKDVCYRVEQFSSGGMFCEKARQELEEKFFHITEITNYFSRRSVSYQLSKKDCLHRWLKYKEGFSAELVDRLLDEMGIQVGEIVLDPFLGSGTTCLVAQLRGINSIGFDIMPMSKASMYAKGNLALYDVDELHRLVKFIASIERPKSYMTRTRSIKITDSAYPDETALDIPFFSEAIKNSSFSSEAKGLANLCLVNCLERLSYTAKDGQYLRWDVRSKKVREANKARAEKGMPPFKVVLNKGELPSVKGVMCAEINKAIDDITCINRAESLLSKKTWINFKQCSALTELPKLESNSICGVITSPPYCNRYDYTRIYALELVHLGMDENEIRRLRQDLLSCTVESKNKLEYLKEYYLSIGKEICYDEVVTIIQKCDALDEVLQALSYRKSCGDINNNGVISMVKGYFEELTFIFYELFRVCKNGGQVAFVNDNVRYAGEVIPVDFISTELAKLIGFRPLKIMTLKQQKGNSSQQMKKFGRVPLRKSITLWQK